jgi:hypothetical protein
MATKRQSTKKKANQEPDKFYAEINYDYDAEGLHMAVAYNPFRLIKYLLEGFVAYHIFEKLLQEDDGKKPIFLTNKVSQQKCPKHDKQRIDFGIGFKESKYFKDEPMYLFDYRSLFEEFTEVGDELEWKTDKIEEAAKRAEKWIRRHLTDKLHRAMISLFIESVYVALGEKVPAKERDYLQSITSLIDTCGVLESKKPGEKNRSKYKWESSEIKKLKNNYKKFSIKYKEADKLFHKVASSKNWRMLVKTDHPDLPDDLIEHLADPNPYDWIPSNLAIEHSARVSVKGYKPYSLTPRQLKKYLNKTALEIKDIHTD